MKKEVVLKNIIILLALIIAAIVSYVFVLLNLCIIAIILWILILIIAILIAILKFADGGCGPFIILFAAILFIIITINSGLL